MTQFQRRQVNAKQVLWPMIILLLCTIVCLCLWTSLDPWSWEREIISENPPESYGQCTSDHFVAYFCCLSSLMILGTSLALRYAWKTHNIKMDEKFDDSKAVGLAVSSQLQAWLVGLPILVVMEESSLEATYLCRVLLIWIFSLTSLLTAVAPKLVHTWRIIQNPSLVESSWGTVYISGLTLQQRSGSGMTTDPNTSSQPQETHLPSPQP